MPIPLSLGPNSFDNTPATSNTISLAGTSCSFGTYYAESFHNKFYSFTPAQTASYVFSTCNTVSKPLCKRMALHA